jgi:hypothetical protein
MCGLTAELAAELEPSRPLSDDGDVSLVERYYRGAGTSTMRRYKSLSRDWRRRMFGKRTPFYVWTLWGLSLAAVLVWTSGHWRLLEGFFFGMLAMAFWMFPEAVMPDHIARWQRGAWGEQSTARALKALRKQGWLVRHDLATGYGKANRDHVAAGPSVYLLDSKLLKDEVWLDDAGLHVRRMDESGDEYVIPDLTRRMNGAATGLKRDLDAAVGFPVAVYPVVVVWGHFAAGAQWDGNVAYVDGDRIATWLAERPADLLDQSKRQAVQLWLRALPRA